MSTRRLLDAASELIAEVGYDRATLAAIGERAGYSHGLVTRRFGSKEGLLSALVERMFQWRSETVRPNVGERVGIEAIRVIVSSISANVEEHPKEMLAFYSLIFEALRPVPILHARVAEIHEELYKDVAWYIRKGAETGQVRSDVDATSTARVFVGALRGCAYQWLLDPSEFPIVATLRTVYDTIERALTPVPG